MKGKQESELLKSAIQQLEEKRQQLADKDQEVAELRAQLAVVREQRDTAARAVGRTQELYERRAFPIQADRAFGE